MVPAGWNATGTVGISHVMRGMTKALTSIDELSDELVGVAVNLVTDRTRLFDGKSPTGAIPGFLIWGCSPN